MSIIFFTGEAVAGIREHALRDYPHECCGAILGFAGEEARTAVAILPIENISGEDRRRRFSISSRDYIGAEREADRRGLALLGFYHSHPDHPAEPSETDRKFAQIGFSYPIVNVSAGGTGPLRSWRIPDHEGWYEEETIAIGRNDSSINDRPSADQQREI